MNLNAIRLFRNVPASFIFVSQQKSSVEVLHMNCACPELAGYYPVLSCENPFSLVAA